MTISLIIPVYNVKPYLRRCLDSVAEQDTKDGTLDVIIIDDASTDGSREIVHEYCVKNPAWLMISHGENKGLSAARNSGIDKAIGDYITFLDSDDKLLPGAVQAWKDAIKKHPDADILQFNHIRYYKKTGLTSKKYANHDGEFSVKNYLDCGAWQGAWNKVVKREACIPFNPLLRYGEDGFWVIQMLLEGHKITTVDQETIMHYFERPDSLTKIVNRDQLIRLDQEQRELLYWHSYPGEPWDNIKAIVDMIQGCHDNEHYKEIRGDK